jgi:hypothetical protein
MSAAACDLIPLVDRHFAVRISPAEERRLRAHLPDCAACRERYARQSLLARLDPRAPSAAQRLARGLGVSLPRPARPLLPALGVVAAAACLALLVVRAPGVDGDQGFTARGGGTPPAYTRLQVYAVASKGVVTVGAQVNATQELVFGYRNLEAKRFLMVFARDAAGRVYWYHPSWTEAEQDPAAIPIAAGQALHELPEAIAQPLAAGPLQLHALFLDTPLTVRQLEARLGQGQDVEAVLPPGAVHERRDLQVKP